MNPISRFLIRLLAACALASGSLHAQTFNWGSEVFSDLVDSKGETLDNTYIFELGSFVNGFVPDETNTADWHGNWQTFDRAAYNGIEETDDDGIQGYFISTEGLQMTADGTSNSAALTPGAISFEGLDAYMWIRNSDLAQAGSEWLLVRADSWVFPTVDDDCCPTERPYEFSTSDLNVELENGGTLSYTPVWGAQGTQTGGGTITSPGSYTLQTATFVPEPSTPLLCLIGGLLLCLRRKR